MEKEKPSSAASNSGHGLRKHHFLRRKKNDDGKTTITMPFEVLWRLIFYFIPVHILAKKRVSLAGQDQTWAVAFVVGDLVFCLAPVIQSDHGSATVVLTLSRGVLLLNV